MMSAMGNAGSFGVQEMIKNQQYVIGDGQWTINHYQLTIIIKVVLAKPLLLFQTGSSGVSMYVLIVEYVGKRHRHVVGTALWYFWVISLMLLPLFAYLIRDWRKLSFAGAAPGLLQIFFWW